MQNSLLALTIELSDRGLAMPSQIAFTQACSNFEEVYDEVLSRQEPVEIVREGFESISLIPTSELSSILETLYLFQSPENASRLLEAIQRAKLRVTKPQTVEALIEEFGLDEGEEKVSA
jgi:antitoxin YefM